MSGRHILEEDLVQEIVLMANPGVILMPGQTLPLTIFRPNHISLMKKLIDTTKTFGSIHVRYHRETRANPAMHSVECVCSMRKVQGSTPSGSTK